MLIRQGTVHIMSRIRILAQEKAAIITAAGGMALGLPGGSIFTAAAVRYVIGGSEHSFSSCGEDVVRLLCQLLAWLLLRLYITGFIRPKSLVLVCIYAEWLLLAD